jgi:cytochrome c oxidase assembly protein subunit 19
MVLFMDCMRRNEFDSHKCRSLSKAYLKCRMEKDLMAKEDLSKLGFPSQSGPD